MIGTESEKSTFYKLSVGEKSDGEILYAMLTGTGHEPVLQRVVPPPYRWYLVLYVRQFNDSNTPLQK